MSAVEIMEIHRALLHIDSLAELQKVQTVVRERWKVLQRMEAAKASGSMGPGVKAKFFARDAWIHGVIEKWNTKTASVRVDDGQRWRVAAGRLEAA